MTVVSEMRYRRRFLRRQGGFTWTVIAIVVSAAATLAIFQALGWAYLF